MEMMTNVEGKRRDGESRITEEKKEEKRRKDKGLPYGLLYNFSIIIKEASTGNVIIPKCEIRV